MSNNIQMMMDKVQEYIRIRKNVNVTINYPDNAHRMVLLKQAYIMADKWLKQKDNGRKGSWRRHN